MLRRIVLPVLCLVLLGLVLPVLPLAAQEGQPSAEEAAMMEAYMKAAMPGEEHSFLADQAGTFKVKLTQWMDPNAPPMTSEGKAVRTMTLGGRVVAETFTATVMGTPYEGFGQSGYDNVTGKYWGTWTDNMSTGISIVEGTWDEASGKGTFEGESPDPMSGGKIRMRMEVRHEDGKEINEMYMAGPDGKMVKTMELVYERE